MEEYQANPDAYLAANPEAGIDGLEGLVASGRYHDTLRTPLQGSLALALEDDRVAYAEEVAQRELVARALEALLASYELHALAYPTIRRKAAPHGERQLGTNCRLAANSGLPAITVPAGFTGDGLPVGIELLGAPWSEAQLLSLAWAVEQAFPPRIPPRIPPVMPPR